MLSENLRQNGPLLVYLKNASPKVQRTILQSADSSLLKALVEVAYNILHGNVPLTPSQKSQLGKHKTHLRKLVRKSCPNHQRKQILQRGGVIGSLVGPLISILPAILPALLAR